LIVYSSAATKMMKTATNDLASAAESTFATLNIVQSYDSLYAAFIIEF